MANQDSESSSGFKVVDKRRFTATGEVRPGALVEEARPAVASTVAPKEAAGPAGSSRDRAGAEAATGAGASRRSGADFLGFVASLATHALAALGVLAGPGGKVVSTDPQAAREYIEIINMLAEKTKGNLTREEEAALQRLQAELKIHFVEVMRRGARL